MKRIVNLACALLLTATVGVPSVAFLQSAPPQSAPPASQSPKQEAVELVLGRPVERELKGGETHAYTLNLKAGEYVEVQTEQKGIDVAVVVVGLDGKQFTEVSTSEGTQGLEPVYLAAEVAGPYRFEVQALEKEAKPGKYEIKIVEQRAAGRKDWDRMAALKTFNEAKHLRNQQEKAAREEAIEKFKAAATLYQAIEDQSNQASALHEVGITYWNLGRPRQSLEYFQRALPLSRAAGDRLNEAATLNATGVVYRALGENQKALECYTQALLLYREMKDLWGESVVLDNLGVMYTVLGNKEKAIDSLTQALTLRRALGNRRGEAQTLTGLGRIYGNIGEMQKAIDFFMQSLLLYHSIVNDEEREAITLNNIAGIYVHLGEYQKALNFFNESLKIVRGIGNIRLEATVLTGIGQAFQRLGENQKALDSYKQAFPLRRLADDRGGEAVTYNNIGLVYQTLGEHQKAIDSFFQALPLRSAVGDREGEAATLNNIGSLVATLGDHRKALEFLDRALSIRREISDRRGEAITLTNIGVSHLGLGKRREALDAFNQALLIHRAVGDRLAEAQTLDNIGSVYRQLQRVEQALDFKNQALLLRRAISDLRGQAKTLSDIGAIYSEQGDRQRAIDSFKEALVLYSQLGDRRGEANNHFVWAQLERDQGDLLSSRTKIEEAIKLVEFIRSNVSNQNLRSSYFATVRGYYDLYIDILMRMHKADPRAGHDLEALQVSERARARGLLELLVESRADIRQGVDPRLIEQERSLQDRLKGKQERLTRLLVGKHTPEQADEAKKEIDALTDEYRQVQTKIRQTSPRYAALTQPEPLTVKQLQRDVLDSDTVLLEYALGEDKSYLWAVTKDTISGVELPKRADIEPTARKLYDLLKSRGASGEWRNISKADKATPQGEYLTTATALSKLLLSPVADKLAGKRLVVVADGALQYIPFAALPEPESIDKKKSEPLVVRHEIVSLPSASALAVLRNETKDRQPAPKTLAVLADPVFSTDDQRIAAAKSAEPSAETAANLARERVLSRMVATSDDEVPDADRAAKEQRLVIPRLPYTRDEAEQIGRFAESDRLFKALDFQASRETATGDELSRYRYVHFATHGLLDAERPELSSIVLSLVDKEGKVQDGFLRAFDVYNLNLPAEVVTLSACKTGLGKDIKGEGLVGLTRGFMYAGARRVVVSLWAVNDKATAELMTRFYRKMLKEGQRPAAALRMAQVEMWRDKQWNAPFYWAGFTLQGEWR